MLGNTSYLIFLNYKKEDRYMKSIKLLFAFVFLLPIFVHAQAPSNPPAKDPGFKSVDKDNNGQITKEEAKAAGVSDADFKKSR